MKKKYYVQIVETLSRIAPVEAESEAQAEDIVRNMYDDCEVWLTDDDFDVASFEVLKDYQPFGLPQ